MNAPIIHFYEDAFAFQRRWLLKWAQRRNLRRHETLYKPLWARRQMHEAAATLVREDGHEPEEGLRRIHSAMLAIDDAHARLEEIEGNLQLPIDASFVTPTALGNAYAVLEAYPYDRDGIDGMVFWPRLLAVLPDEYRNSVSEQKMTCDFLLNLSLLLTLFAIEVMVLSIVAGQVNSTTIVAAIIIAIVSVLVAYGLYRVAVAETRVLGKLIASGFDLYRGSLLQQFGLRIYPKKMMR